MGNPVSGIIPPALEGDFVAMKDLQKVRQEPSRGGDRYRNMFMALDDGFCVIEVLFDERGEPVDYRFLEVNDAFEKQTGLVDARGRTARELIPNLEEKWFQSFGRVAKTRRPSNFIEGSEAMGRWWRLHAFPIAEPHENQVAIRFADITESRLELLERDQLVKQRQMALDAAKLGWWHYDPATGRGWWDGRYKKIFDIGEDGASLEEALSGIHPEDRPSVDLAIEAALDPNRLQPYAIEFRIRVGDGSIRWVEAHGSVNFQPLENSRATMLLVGAVADVTTRKQAEQALRDSELRFREFADTTPAINWVTEADGSCSFMSDDWYEFTGQTEETALGFGWLNAVHPDYTEETRRVFDEASLKKEAFRLVYRLRQRDGNYRWALNIAKPRFAGAKLAGYVGSVIDINEQKLAEMERDRVNLLLTTILDTSPDVIAAKDREGRYVSMNQAGLRILGRPLDQVLGRTDHDLSSEEVAGPIMEVDRAVMERGTVISDEEYYPDSTGTFHDYRTVKAPMKNLAGETVGLTVVSRDVSEERRTQRALADQLRRTQAIMNNATTAMFIVDERQHCVYMNPAAEKLTGFSAAEVKGRSLHEVVHHTRPDGTLSPIEECPKGKAFLQSNQVHGEEIFVHRDGSFYPVEFTASPLRDGDTITGMMVEVQDIRFRKLAEAALVESESRFRQLADAMPQMVWAARPDGYPDYCNERWFEFTGFDRDAFGGQWEKLLHPDDVRQSHDAWCKAVETGQPYHVHYRFWDRSENRWRWFLGRALPVFDATGRIVRWFGTCTDIDEQKRIEEKLREVNRDLEQFAHSASHDLQEPLRSIAIYSELLFDRYSGKLDQQGQEFLVYLRGGAVRMQALVTDLLEYTQTSSLEAPTTMTDATPCLQFALANLSNAVAESDAEIKVTTLPNLKVHPVHLQQLFQNLIGNSIKYKHVDRYPIIRVEFTEEATEWRFAVSDNGIGIDSQYKERIFGIFKRLHSRDEYDGTGIGLAICQRIVERYGGRIWVESILGTGTTFYFTLPK